MLLIIANCWRVKLIDYIFMSISAVCFPICFNTAYQSPFLSAEKHIIALHSISHTISLNENLLFFVDNLWSQNQISIIQVTEKNKHQNNLETKFLQKQESWII